MLIKAKNNLLLLLISLFFLCAYSCRKNEPVCYEPKDVRAVIKYSQKRVTEIDSMRDTVIVDTTIITYPDTLLPYLNATSLDIDSPFTIYSSPYASSIGLFLNPDESQTRYLIRYDTASATEDILTIFHKAKPVFISNACGYTYYFTVDSIRYESDLIDSFALTQPEVTMERANGERMANFYFFE